MIDDETHPPNVHTRGVCKVCANFRQVLIPGTGRCLYCTPGRETGKFGDQPRMYLPNLRARRLAEGLTLMDLAEVTGISHTSISIIENGRPAIESMCNLLAEALWCSVEDLGGTNVNLITKGTKIMGPRNQKGKNGWSQSVAQ